MATSSPQHDGGPLLDPVGEEEARLSRMATLGALACMLAHEMNNLLTPVLNYSKLALDAPANDRLSRRAHESAVASVEACNTMANSLLGFAASDGLEEADVAACVARSIECIPRDLAKDGVRVEIDTPRGLAVAMPTTALVQVVLNLVLNARRAIQRGGAVGAKQGGWIEVRAERSTWNTGGAVMLSVRDSGVGMDAATAERVFNPFFSVGGESDGESGGAGLGLAICRRLVEDAGGAIEVESAPGEGACFTLTVPEAAARGRAA